MSEQSPKESEPFFSIRRVLAQIGWLDELTSFHTSKNEFYEEEYLKRLEPQDKDHVEWVIDLIDYIVNDLRNNYKASIKTGIIAVGSTAQPASEIEQPPEDIDLVLLNSTQPMSLKRVGFLKLLDWELRHHVNSEAERQKGITKTPGITLSITNEYDCKVYGFQFRGSDLPVNLIVGYQDTPSMRQHLKLERMQEEHFALLYQS